MSASGQMWAVVVGPAGAGREEEESEYRGVKSNATTSNGCAVAVAVVIVASIEVVGRVARTSRNSNSRAAAAAAEEGGGGGGGGGGRGCSRDGCCSACDNNAYRSSNSWVLGSRSSGMPVINPEARFAL